MKPSEKYSRIFKEANDVGIPNKQVQKLIKVWKEEFIGEPVSFGDLLEVLE